jgi:hypothetical protein
MQPYSIFHIFHFRQESVCLDSDHNPTQMKNLSNELNYIITNKYERKLRTTVAVEGNSVFINNPMLQSSSCYVEIDFI